MENQITGQELVEQISEERKPQAKPWIRRDFPFVILSIIVLSVAFGFARSEASVSPEELRRQADEAKLEAMIVDCETIGSRVLECYKGDKRECTKLHESNAWFSNEYGATPALLCPTRELFQ